MLASRLVCLAAVQRSGLSREGSQYGRRTGQAVTLRSHTSDFTPEPEPPPPVEKVYNNRTFGSLKVKDLSPAPLREALYVVSRPRILIVNTSLPRR